MKVKSARRITKFMRKYYGAGLADEIDRLLDLYKSRIRTNLKRERRKDN